MADVIIFSAFDLYLIGIATLLSLITAILYFGLAKRKENPNEKSINSAYAWIWVFITIYLILLYLSFFYIEGYYIGYIYRGNFDNPSLIYMWLVKCRIISFFAGLIFYFYTYEKIFNKRIHLATFGNILIIILIIISPYELVIYQFYPLMLIITTLYLFHSYFTLMKWSQSELRAATSFIILGSLFLGISMYYMSPARMQLGDTPILIFPTLLIFGTFLCMAPTVFKPKFFSRNIKYWYLFSILLISAPAILTVYYVTISDLIVIETFIGGVVLVIFFTIESVIFIRFIKREEILFFEGDTGVRGIFTKPEKVTEEEVSISKEKKICLVCKGRIARFNIYICPECDVLYCENCARTLSDSENICWVCETPFDESKPSIPFKTEEEAIDLEISEKSQKKGIEKK